MVPMYAMPQVSHQVNESTALYLQNHEGAATGGAQLFRRVADSQRDRPWGPQVVQLSREVAQDLGTLRRLMKDLEVPRNLPLGLAMQAGELVGRLKPNGRILRRSPLSDLVEVEGLYLAVKAKAAGWQALLAANPGRFADPVQLLADRADDQIERLALIHRTVASAVME